ncbi:hypothetical protein [Pseudonocardia sp. ICBG1293]|uniref:hypothetical protein n=1 Tax=Pseudonocardia sp. ICBG1293 TaxID=2844382 RepID=UPI001CCA625A|nr:hypothetical protein [Pseudonocardia sp. ICBG1293]
MAEETSWTDDLYKIGEKLTTLMEGDMSVFADLERHWPEAGNFKTGLWLENVMDDRRNAVVQQGERMNIALQELGKGVKSIATDLEEVDKDNASEIKKVVDKELDDVTDSIGDRLNEHAEAVEDEERNFTQPEDGPSETNGYESVNKAPSYADSFGSDDSDSDSDSDDDGDGDDEDDDEDDDHDDEDEGADDQDGSGGGRKDEVNLYPHDTWTGSKV